MFTTRTALGVGLRFTEFMAEEDVGFGHFEQVQEHHLGDCQGYHIKLSQWMRGGTAAR